MSISKAENVLRLSAQHFIVITEQARTSSAATANYKLFRNECAN